MNKKRVLRVHIADRKFSSRRYRIYNNVQSSYPVFDLVVSLPEMSLDNRTRNVVKISI